MLRQVRELSLVSLLVLAGCTKESSSGSSAPPPPPAPAVQKGRAPLVTDTYAVAFDPGTEWQIGVPGQAKISLTAKSGFHVNPEYPVALKVDASAENFKLPEQRLALQAATKTPCTDKAEDTCAAEYPVVATPTKAGEVPLSGTFMFSVCTADKCLIEKVAVNLALNVAP